MEMAAANSDCATVFESASLPLAGSWTVSAWVSLASIPASGQAYALVVKPNAFAQHNYALFLDHGYLGNPNLSWVATFQDVSGTSWPSAVTDAVTANTWYQVAGVWDGTRLTLYVNGTARSSTTPGAVPNASPYTDVTPMTMLGHNQCCAQWLDGALDDVRIYNRALATDEIATLYIAP